MSLQPAQLKHLKQTIYHLRLSKGKITVELRDKIGWSQADLAGKSGVSRVMIGKYERGEAVPSIDAAKKIADALRYHSITWLVKACLMDLIKKHSSDYMIWSN